MKYYATGFFVSHSYVKTELIYSTSLPFLTVFKVFLGLFFPEHSFYLVLLFSDFVLFDLESECFVSDLSCVSFLDGFLGRRSSVDLERLRPFECCDWFLE
jgi:hypothetical protein